MAEAIEEISDIFTPEGIKKLKKGQILVFDAAGTKTELKITRINKRAARVWAKRVYTFTEEEVKVRSENNIIQSVQESINDRSNKNAQEQEN